MCAPVVADGLSIAGLRKWPFILWRGIIGWGVPSGVFFALLMSMENIAEKLPVMLPLSLIVFPSAGILFGQTLWQSMIRLELRNGTLQTSSGERIGHGLGG